MAKKLLILFLLLLCSNNSYALTNYCGDTDNVGCWGMEDATTENDLSSNDEDLTVSASDTIPQSADKVFGTYSRDFETSEADYLYHADGGSTDLSGANQKVSTVAWVKFESTTPIKSIVSHSGSGIVSYNMWRDMSGHIGAFLSSDGSGTSFALSTSTGSNGGAWVHAAMTYDDTYIRIYFNGVVESSADNPKSYSNGLYASSAKFCIGAADGVANFDGLIDDVAVFRDDLTSTEVNDIMDNGLFQSTTPSGWIHDMNRVPNVSISKINGIPIANVNKVNGI